MLQTYWNPVFNDSWIYLSDELILENLTNDTSKYALRNFYNRILIPTYEENIDYKQVSLDNEIVKSWWSDLSTNKSTRKPPSNKKYIILGETYKTLLMTSRAVKGKETRRYYIKVETLARHMKDYIFYFMLDKLEKENFRLLRLHNTRFQKHRYLKFKMIGSAFYIIVYGLELSLKIHLFFINESK